MQIWKWLLMLGLLFLITYEPSRGGGKLINFFTNDSVGGNGFPERPTMSGEAQKYSDSGDDDQ
jgi:hypothetical protein